MILIIFPWPDDNIQSDQRKLINSHGTWTIKKISAGEICNILIFLWHVGVKSNKCLCDIDMQQVAEM